MTPEILSVMHDRGWAVIPLGLDARGKPKRPIPQAWQRTVPTTKHSFSGAKGMGVVLGANSHNLAVIDIDDQELARKAFSAIATNPQARTRMVWTTSGNIHVYVQEETPSTSTAFKVKVGERTVGVELKAQGTQVAAPPTPGYQLAIRRETEPQPVLQVPTIRAAWDALARKLGVFELVQETGNYPKPWMKEVPKGERNKAVYVEACRLREAGMPYQSALELMQARWDQAYESGGTSWRETERTILSAYQHGQLQAAEGYKARWIDNIG